MGLEKNWNLEEEINNVIVNKLQCVLRRQFHCFLFVRTKSLMSVFITKAFPIEMMN